MDAVLTDILNEPSVVADTLEEGRVRLPAITERLKGLPLARIYAVGAGSSHFVGLAARYVLERWAGLPTLPLSSTDFERYAVEAANPASLVLAISQSGETAETLAAAEAARRRGVPVIALTNDEQSRLAQMCDSVILLRAGHESGPGTKTVIAQCVAVYQFGLWYARAMQPERKEAVASALAELDRAPELISDMLAGTTAEAAERLARFIVPRDHLYLIGGGPLSALAFQVANVLRETGKLHCYPFEAVEFRHGPLEALSAHSTLLAFFSRGSRIFAQTLRACSVARQAGADLVYVGDRSGRPTTGWAEELLLPEMSEGLAAQLYLAPLQLVSYHVAKTKGLDPNVLVNIVKTWTT
jgi:glucosamine--fructose-6-phosphate aminotransferase (isomerizing)